VLYLKGWLSECVYGRRGVSLKACLINGFTYLLAGCFCIISFIHKLSSTDGCNNLPCDSDLWPALKHFMCYILLFVTFPVSAVWGRMTLTFWTFKLPLSPSITHEMCLFSINFRPLDGFLPSWGRHDRYRRCISRFLLTIKIESIL